MNTTFSTLFLRRNPRGNTVELGRIRCDLAPDSSPAAIEAVAAKQARREGVNVALATERVTFRLLQRDPRTGAETWGPLSRSGDNTGEGFDGVE
jgi:hypothetical protein